jgi:hypothetical protein
MPLLMPEMIDSGKLTDIEIAMRKDLRAAAKLLKGKNVFFVVAQNVPTVDKKKISLFIVSKLEAEAKAWQLKLKGKKPQVLVTGTCTLQTKDGATVAVALDKVRGDRKAALKTARLAFKTDVKVRVADPQDEGRKADEPSAPASAADAKAKRKLDSIAPGIGAMVDRAPVDNTQALKLLERFERLGLSPDQLKAALQATFG